VRIAAAALPRVQTLRVFRAAPVSCPTCPDPSTPPQEFREIPVTLIHPAQDRWTPPEMSLDFLRHIAAPTRHLPLEGCGHFPVEEPGLSRAVEVLREVLERVVGRNR
jgi:alpha-beta hydrolase superfamily lysophospholipase